MNFEALLFDMDGVVIDTKESVNEFWNTIAKQYYGKKLSQKDFNYNVYGCTAVHTLNMLFPDLNSVNRKDVLSKMEVYETKLIYKEVNGFTSFLRTLYNNDLPTALVTSGKQWKVNRVIHQLGIEELFTFKINADDFHNSKPDPECYLLAARLLKKHPNKCVVFEDAISGIMAAVSSGAVCIGVQSSISSAMLLKAGAKHVIQDFSVINILRNVSLSKTLPQLKIGDDMILTLA